MSKTIGEDLKTHLEGPVRTVAVCVKCTLTDETVLGFTNHSDDITYDGTTYHSETGANLSSIAASLGLNVDNQNVEGPYDSTNGIARANILKGTYDFAAIETFIINFKDSTQGIMNLPLCGWIGEQITKDNQFEFELRSLTQKLQEPIGIVIAPGCRHDLGDTNCGITLSDYTETKTVTGVIDNQNFTSTTAGGSEVSGYYTGGLIIWTGGNNSGLEMEIKTQTYAGGTYSIELVLPMTSDIAATDTFTMSAGCDKSIDTCISKFGNVIRDGGFPYVPGPEVVNLYPDDRSG